MTHHSVRMSELQDAGRWPEWLPRDYTELHTQFGAFVIHLIRKHNKVDRDPRDLINHVWVELLRVDVLTKYVEAACGEPPEVLSATDAAEFLGISIEQFFTYLRSEKCLLGEPLEGTRYSKTARWAMDGLIEVAQIACFRKQGQIKLPTPVVSRSHFSGYLARAVHNIFVNYCRTRSRRHKEQTGDCFPQLHPIASDPTSWEDRLVDEGTKVEERADILHLAHRVRKALPGRESEILSMLGDGYTLPEAIENLNGLTAVRKRIVLRALRSI